MVEQSHSPKRVISHFWGMERASAGSRSFAARFCATTQSRQWRAAERARSGGIGDIGRNGHSRSRPMLEVRRTQKGSGPASRTAKRPPRARPHKLSPRRSSLYRRETKLGIKLNGLELDGRRRGMLLQESLDGRLAVSGAQAPVGLRAQRAK